MRDWIHWLWQQWEWEGDLSPELTREVVRAEEALLDGFTPEQRELYEAMEDARERRDLRVLPGTILTSGRRYLEGGPLRTMARMFWLRCLYRAGVDIHRIARLYRDVR